MPSRSRLTSPLRKVSCFTRVFAIKTDTPRRMPQIKAHSTQGTFASVPARIDPQILFESMAVEFRHASAIDVDYYDIDAAENYHYVGDGMAETKGFQHGEINKTRRTHPITVRIRSAITDQIKSELAFWSFDPSIGFADRRPKRAHFDFRIHDRSGGNLGERLFENLDALVHLESSHHQSIISIAMIAERNAEFESRIDSVAVDFPNVVIHAARAQHR